MGWKEFREASSKVYHFEKQHCPEYWVRLKGIDTMPWGRSKRYFGAELNDDEATREAEELLRESILDWYIPDPDDEGRVLPLPKDDPDVLNKLPNAFITQMQIWLMEGVNVEELVPTMNERHFAPPS